MNKGPVFQKSADDYDPRGHLDPVGFQRHVTFETIAPPDDLAPFVEHFWMLSWDRAGQGPYVSEQVMHRPYVDLFFSREETGIQSTFRGRRDYVAAETGRIVGVRFRPGAFHAFWQGSLAGLRDRNLDIRLAFPQVDAGFVERVLAAGDAAAADLLAGLLRSKNPQPDPNIELINAIIAAVETDDSLQTVKAVAKKFMWSERTLQQLFSDYVGTGIKWLLLRQKLLGAAKYIRETADPDWAALAYELGYNSQQHFITDFKRVLGKTPVQFKKDLTV